MALPFLISGHKNSAFWGSCKWTLGCQATAGTDQEMSNCHLLRFCESHSALSMSCVLPGASALWDMSKTPPQGATSGHTEQMLSHHCSSTSAYSSSPSSPQHTATFTASDSSAIHKSGNTYAELSLMSQLLIGTGFTQRCCPEKINTAARSMRLLGHS